MKVKASKIEFEVGDDDEMKLAIALSIVDHIKENYSKKRAKAGLGLFQRLYNNIVTKPEDKPKRVVSKTVKKLKDELFTLGGCDALLLNSGFTASANTQQYTYERNDLTQLKSVKEMIDNTLQTLK